MPKIEFQMVRLDYGSTEVALDLSFQVLDKEIVCFFGSSGCGKSTILKAILGLIRPSAGNIQIDGESPSEYLDEVAVVPQGNELCEWRNVYENVCLWSDESQNSRVAGSQIEAKRALDLVQMEVHSKKYPNELSGGMARRTALACCFATKSNLMLVDEAFGSVERKLRRELMEIVRSHIKSAGITAIFVSHDYEEAIFVSDRILCLSAAPTQVIRDLTVGLPLHRTKDLFDSDEYRNTAFELVSL